MCDIEQANYRGVAYSSHAARQEAAPPGGVQMVSRFDILRVEADEFTWPAQIELPGAARPGEYLVQAFALWLPLCRGSAL
jgi:hypothetical protein